MAKAKGLAVVGKIAGLDKFISSMADAAAKVNHGPAAGLLTSPCTVPSA